MTTASHTHSCCATLFWPSTQADVDQAWLRRPAQSMTQREQLQTPADVGQAQKTAGAAHALHLPLHCARRLLCSASVCDAPAPYSRAAAAGRVHDHADAAPFRPDKTPLASRLEPHPLLKGVKRAAAQQGRVPRVYWVLVMTSNARAFHCALCALRRAACGTTNSTAVPFRIRRERRTLHIMSCAFLIIHTHS